MIRQEIPLLRNNELPSAASYNALANPIRNITSLTPEMLRITQNRSNGGLQFEILPHTHVKAAEEEKEEFSLNCSFLITVGEKNANNEN